jgi:PAS domain S-box-containing protein
MELAQSEARFRDIFDQVPVGIVRVDPADRILQANQEFCRIVGVAPSELLGNPRSSIFVDDHDSPGTPEDPLPEGSADERSALRRIRRPDGGYRLTRVRDVLVSDQDGNRRVTLATLSDVTDQVRLSEELRRAQEMEALGRLAAGIAHEINTPTQFILDNLSFLTDMWEGLSRLVDTSMQAAQRLREGSDPEEIASLLATAITDGDLGYAQSEVPTALAQSQEGTRRVASIVKAMKAFGHPDQDRPESTDINQMIQDTLTVARGELKYSADVTTDLASLPIVSCYRGAMSQVILNLLVNASHAVQDSAHRGRITIRTSFDGTAAQIEVADNGPGIPSEILPKIFQPFFTTKPVGQGTGQGLALAWSTVVERHKGTIDVSSSPSGTTFTIRIPACAGHPPYPALPAGNHTAAAPAHA